jgi:anaerobic magnesium-protoporphyrin IX monomethyl ester cyclase
MKILLINPPYTNFEGIKESGGHMMPLNLAYLAAYAREKIDCEIVILDAEVMGLSYEQIEESIRKEQPDVVGITCPSSTMGHVFKISEIAKKVSPKCVVVVGGNHPTALPKETIQSPFIDFAVVGEGEATFYELLKAIKNDEHDFNKIDGLYFKKDGKIVATKPRQLIADLDTIPFPARDLFQLDRYYQAPTKKVSDNQAGPILTKRGCAFNCTHCISANMWTRNPRFRSTQNIIKEMEECINKYGIKEFNIFDDTFTLNKERSMEICDEIINRKLNISWVALSRVNTIPEELIKKMKQAGCKKISFGLESGSQEVLDLMRKQTTLEMARKALDSVAKHGILIHASFMFGNLGETEETIKKTIEFSKSLPLDNATFFITSPYPGTYLYDVAKKEGFITPDTKWEEFAPLTNTAPVLVQKNLSKERLVYWQKRAFREFHLRPKYILRKAKQIKSLSGLKTIFEGARVLFRILILKNEKNP